MTTSVTRPFHKTPDLQDQDRRTKTVFWSETGLVLRLDGLRPLHL